MKREIKIQIMPYQSWGVNARNCLPDIWKQVKESTKGMDCQICFSNKEIQCHEEFRFEKSFFRDSYTMTMERIVPVCSDCHKVIHYGRTEKLASFTELTRLLAHLCKVNNISPDEALDLIMEAKAKAEKINEGEVMLNLNSFKDVTRRYLLENKKRQSIKDRRYEPSALNQCFKADDQSEQFGSISIRTVRVGEHIKERNNQLEERDNQKRTKYRRNRRKVQRGRNK